MSPFDRAGRSGSEPPGNDFPGLLLDLGGTIVSISSESENWLSEAKRRYGAFVRNGGLPEISIFHSLDEDAMLERVGFLSVVRPAERTAEIAAFQGTDVLDGVLRTLLPAIIVPDLMVHGTLFSADGGGFLCCGVSGAGKSTIAALFPEATLCDELARLHIGPGAVEARSLPFWTAWPGTVPLRGIFILEHGEENVRTPLKTTEGIRQLRRHAYWPVEDPEGLNRAVETLFEACRKTPVFRLTFRPEPSVWLTMTEGL